MPRNVAQFDKALEGKDYASINRMHAEVKTFDDILLVMNWEQVRVFSGQGGVYMALLYMGDLWDVASSMDKAGPSFAAQAAEMKQTSVFMGLYAYELIVLDGTKCTDSTAVGHRMDQLLADHASSWGYVPNIPEEMRAKMVSFALLLEGQTADVRGNDDVVCQGGMAQMIAGLAGAALSGQSPQETTKPGTPGRSFAVPPAKGFEVGYVSPESWRPEQAKLRESMLPRLAELMKVKSTAVPPLPKP